MKFFKNSSWALCLVLAIVSVVTFSCNNTSNAGSAVAQAALPATNSQSSTPPQDTMCAWIRALAKKYLDTMDSRIKSVDKVNLHGIDSLAIKVEFGNRYINAFKRKLPTSWGNEKTHLVDLSAEEIAFFITYLYANQSKKEISLALARYVPAGNGETKDPDYERKPSEYLNRLTLIAGIKKSGLSKTDPPLTTDYLQPFEVGNKKFYDDWQGLWP